MARMDGNSGETIGAGIGWAWGIMLDGKKNLESSQKLMAIKTKM